MKRIFWQWYGVIGIVILVSCSRQEAPQQNTSGSLPAVSNQVQTSETDIAQSGSDQAAGVIMRGFITDANRNPLPVCTLNSQARDISGRPFDREPVASIITMGEDGSYAVSNLTLSYYTFNIEAEGYSPYVTNILLTALDTRVDFVFPALTNIHVTGRVIIAETQEPAERIPVILATTAGGKRQQTVNTDINGRFSFQAPAIIGMPIGTLSVDEPGYVPITCNLEARYRSQEIELY